MAIIWVHYLDRFVFIFSLPLISRTLCLYIYLCLFIFVDNLVNFLFCFWSNKKNHKKKWKTQIKKWGGCEFFLCSSGWWIIEFFFLFCLIICFFSLWAFCLVNLWSSLSGLRFLFTSIHQLLVQKYFQSFHFFFKFIKTRK